MKKFIRGFPYHLEFSVERHIFSFKNLTLFMKIDCIFAKVFLKGFFAFGCKLYGKSDAVHTIFHNACYQRFAEFSGSQHCGNIHCFHPVEPAVANGFFYVYGLVIYVHVYGFEAQKSGFYTRFGCVLNLNSKKDAFN